MPEEMVPRIMIRQFRSRIFLDLAKKKKIFLTDEQIQQHKKGMRKKKTDDMNEIFTDFFRRVIRRYRKVKQALLTEMAPEKVTFDYITAIYKRDN